METDYSVRAIIISFQWNDMWKTVYDQLGTNNYLMYNTLTRDTSQVWPEIWDNVYGELRR
jgi:hypothetical protein